MNHNIENYGFQRKDYSHEFKENITLYRHYYRIDVTVQRNSIRS